MAASIPTSMRALALATYSKPDQYDIATLPTPEITKPDEVLIKVHAASINPVDVKVGAGAMKMMKKETFPMKIGYDAAGTIAAVGTAVKNFKVGDEVYSRVPGDYKGSMAEYVLSPEWATALKPSTLSFTEAAAVPLAALTALQCMQRAEAQLSGGIKGKTVYVPGGLSGTGSFAVQLAKNVFGAKEVITTLSTGKIAKAKELFGGSDGSLRIVDYTKENVVASIGKGTVDYMFDTTGQAISSLAVMKKDGVIVSIATLPSGDEVAKQAPDLPFFLYYMLNLVDWFYRFRIARSSVKYSYIFMKPDAEGLNQLATWIKEGKVTPVVGRTAKLVDIEAVKKGCQEVYDGKGGVGKFVIEVV